jgi:hypothetical protein
MRAPLTHRWLGGTLVTLVMMVNAVPPAAAEPSGAVPRPPEARTLLQSAVEALQSQPAPAPRAKRRDSVLDGVLIGASVGFAVGLFADYYDDCEECHDALWGSIAYGAGIGLGLDLLLGARNTVSPPTPNRPVVQLGVGKKGVGVRGSISWR